MVTKYFSKVTFWARELRLPLFWLPQIMGQDSLLFYKNSIIHLYHLNNKEKKAAEIGFKFFTNKTKVAGYKKLIQKIFRDIENIVNEYKKIKIKNLSDQELKRKFFDVIKAIVEYSDAYTKTEEIYLTKFESNPNKYKKLMKELGVMRFKLRKEGEPLFYILLGLFLKEIAKRFKIRAWDLFFYRHNEMVNLFNGKKVKTLTIRDRQKGYALILLKNREILLTGNKFKGLFKDVVTSLPTADHFSGKVAMRGRVRGRVRVILHNKRVITKDVAKFNKGEILVTEMTRPDTVMACKKAAAIITDEGGITSHAAIIARELKIPCIIGAKIATQVLKTGTLVEVDADKGIVKIIK